MAMLGSIAVGCWFLAGGAYAVRSRDRRWGDSLAMLGVLAGALLLASLWVSLERPPLRTLGETRWWYAVLVPAMSLLIGWRFKTLAMAIPGVLMGGTFALINLRHPEYMDRTLMPALQSPWFVPHVVVYMLAYSALGLASLLALWLLVKRRLQKQPVGIGDVEACHKLVLVGLPLITCGLLFGAFWAKEAWGHYWTWDPKETWAFVTWGAYVVYLHVRTRHALRPAMNLWLLVVGFVALLLCWFGVNHMPSTADSVHTYTRPA
jgi:ABC-type transport system involved in cytochrome c biogenesis permease subunit